MYGRLKADTRHVFEVDIYGVCRVYYNVCFRLNRASANRLGSSQQAEA